MPPGDNGGTASSGWRSRAGSGSDHRGHSAAEERAPLRHRAVDYAAMSATCERQQAACPEPEPSPGRVVVSPAPAAANRLERPHERQGVIGSDEPVVDPVLRSIWMFGACGEAVGQRAGGELRRVHVERGPGLLRRTFEALDQRRPGEGLPRPRRRIRCPRSSVASRRLSRRACGPPSRVGMPTAQGVLDRVDVQHEGPSRRVGAAGGSATTTGSTLTLRQMPHDVVRRRRESGAPNRHRRQR